MVAIASFTISSLAVLLSAWFASSRVFPRQILPGALFYLSLVLFQITYIELLLGVINHLTSLGIVLGSILSGFVVIWLTFKFVPVAKATSIALETSTDSTDTNLSTSAEFTITQTDRLTQNSGLNRVGILGLSLLALILAIPLYPSFLELLAQITKVHPLSWDVVSYHLPNALDYLQTGSFWTQQNFFNQYPGGNEILQIWSFLPLKLDVFLGVTTATLGLGVLLTATLLLSNVLPATSTFERGVWIIILWIVCLSIHPFQDIFFDLGRNDITIAFWALVSIWTLQQSVTQLTYRNWWLLWTGISLGMAVGTKPIGIFYLIGFVCLTLTRWFPSTRASDPIHVRTLKILPFLVLPAVLIGGFWYARNLIKTGTLSEENLTRAAAELSIFRNLWNPNLYQLNFPFIFLLLCIGITLLATGVYLQNSSHVASSFKLLIGFNWIVILALMITPSGAGYWAGDTPVFLIQIRYGSAIVPVTIILLLAMLSQTFEQLKVKNSDFQTGFSNLLSQLDGQPQTCSTAKFISYLNVAGLLFLIFQFLTYQPPIGLPGFDSILFASNTKPSAVYAWVQEKINHSVIHSIGLRPYGLYGFPFTNQVISRLGSSDWKYQESLEVLRDFKLQFIVISRDPFSGEVPKDIEWLLSQPKAFEIVYRDPLAAVFRVTELGQSLSNSLK